jgi:hypothetical protein
VARRGVFGRLPRAAPDLTNTLVALIREANAQEDSNYVDAWKNGGKVEGHGVDDEALLEHFRKRRDALSPDDPLWDEWNNRVAQYDFSINESKMSLKFDQGKVSEQEVSDFYAKWVKRPEIQQDSEFYRHLLSQQAKWHQAAIQGRAARGASNAYENHQKWVANITKKQTQPAQDAHNYILQIAIAYNAAPANATSLEDVYENSTGWGRVVDIIDNGKTDDPNIQKMLDEATKRIADATGDPNFKFDTSHLTDLDNKADEGYSKLKKNSMNKSERDHWSNEDGKHKYEGARVRSADASKRMAIAADQWTADLDNCNGNPYCAREKTKVYRDAIARETKHLLAGQGEVTLATQDNAQAQMVVTTLRTLDDVIAGKPIKAEGVTALTGIAGAGIEETQADVIARGGKPGDRTPENIIGGFGNIFNDQIKKLDAGGWVSTDVQFYPGTNEVQLDGNGDPIYAFTAHSADEVPAPGLFEVPAVTTFTDPTRPTTGPAGGPTAVGPHSVMPRQYVRAEAPPIVATTEGGDPVDSRNLVATDGKTVLTAPPAGYMVVKVIGPDGNLQTLYRTGSGTATDRYLLHTEPPIKPESAGGPRLTKVNGVMVPVFTAKAGVNAKNEPIMTYDTSPVTEGIQDARNPNSNSLRLPYGTYENIGAAATAKGINDIFNKGGTNATADASKLFRDYSNNVLQLPADQRAKLANDLYQLGATVNLRSKGITQANLDDEYGALIDRTPKQSAYEQQLADRGFTVQNYDKQEIDRRVTLLEQLDQAEGRLGKAGVTSEWMDRYGQLAGGQDPAWRLRQTLNSADAASIEAAKKDIFNPTISVSNIKIPGFNPMMTPGGFTQPQVAGGPTVTGGPVVTGGPIVSGGPKVGTANKAPAGPAAGPTSFGPTTFAPPGALTPPVASGPAAGPTAPPFVPPVYKPPTLEEQRLSGELGYTGPKSGRKILY